ncbi:hypothetical protein QJS10_CPB18g00527 [Acorus calamus]|uniref:Radical S-adenosyl methionine domain-containing protein 1, mitochondrial n=1 Tax=Acorus calamus TaxID=4465 RepID=A0AAV9CNK5_ACOCL|nr:hypothetical protein QJS10_CPB18g00527 [Acorus calamus]
MPLLKTTLLPLISSIPTKPKLLPHQLYPPPICQNSSLTSPHPPVPVLQPHQPICQNSSPPTPPPPTSAYIHLPFCRRRCHYCDFPIVALGSSSLAPPTTTATTDDPRITSYVHLLLREISATPPASDPPLQTVFFGGGTPSLVPPRLVSSILDALRVKFGLSALPEVSIEMDPGTFGAEKLRELIGVGVNRVSLGVQAFQEDLLRSCGRAHGIREVEEAIEIVRSSGLENWSMDLISSLPHQTLGMWEESLRRAVDARPTHLSVYDLQVEQGTKFGQWYTPGESPLPSETESACFYRTASEVLSSAGYDHYEISSYCRDGFMCKHNLAYWQNRSFYAFGLGSASYVNGIRFSRPRSMREYTRYVEKLEGGALDSLENRAGGARDRAMDVVMLSLRTAGGLDVRRLGREFGEGIALGVCEAFRPYVDSGHVVVMDDERRPLSPSGDDWRLSREGENRREVAFIRLSDPDGFLLSNELISIAFGVISP